MKSTCCYSSFLATLILNLTILLLLFPCSPHSRRCCRRLTEECRVGAAPNCRQQRASTYLFSLYCPSTKRPRILYLYRRSATPPDSHTFHPTHPGSTSTFRSMYILSASKSVFFCSCLLPKPTHNNSKRPSGRFHRQLEDLTNSPIPPDTAVGRRRRAWTHPLPHPGSHQTPLWLWNGARTVLMWRTLRQIRGG